MILSSKIYTFLDFLPETFELDLPVINGKKSNPGSGLRSIQLDTEKTEGGGLTPPEPTWGGKRQR